MCALLIVVGVMGVAMMYGVALCVALGGEGRRAETEMRLKLYLATN